MFVIQVDFKDGVSQVESIFIKRLHIRVGTSEKSHLVLDGVAKLNYELVIYRGLGNKFKCKALSNENKEVKIYSWEKDYQGLAQIDLGSVCLTIICITARVAEKIASLDDSKSIMHELQNTVNNKASLYPALYSLSNPPVALSISGVSRVSIGNTRDCLFRSEKFKDKVEKSLLVKSDSGEYLISLVDSREVVKINGQSFQETKLLKAKDKITFSSGLELIYLSSNQDVSDLSEELPAMFFSSGSESKRSIRSVSGPINPSILPLKVGQTISVGRDASHNIWVDAAFISRLHCTIYIEQDGYVITDYSTNGLFVNGKKLTKGRQEIFPLGINELYFGHGAKLLLSELDDLGFQDFLLGKKVGASLEGDVINENAVDSAIAIPAPEEIPEEKESDRGDTLSEMQLRQKTTFEDYQKRSIRLLDESSGQFLSESIINYDSNNLEEFPVRIGLSKYIPQILIGGLIFIILVFFVILALNLVR